MAPKRKGVRPAITAAVDFEILKDLNAGKIDDETWASVTNLLKPYWSNNQYPWFSSSRRLYEAMLRSLRAGAGPSTKLDTSVKLDTVSRIHSQILKRGLWPALLKILRSHGHVWIDSLAPAVLDHLHGICGVPDVPWEVTGVKSQAPGKSKSCFEVAA
jgi:hypothetical protein